MCALKRLGLLILLYMSDEQKIIDCFGVSPLSVTTIANRTGLSRKRVMFLSTTLRRIDPLEVGSRKARLRVFAPVGDASVKAQ